MATTIDPNQNFFASPFPTADGDGSLERKAAANRRWQSTSAPNGRPLNEEEWRQRQPPSASQV